MVWFIYHIYMSSSLPLSDLIALSKNRWAMALLADLAAHRGARFVELLNRLNLSRDSLSRTLDAAKAAGWIIPNPGHGHPLRPEYLLSEEGARMATAASAILATQQQLNLSAAQLNRWSLPLVRAIDLGDQRFNALIRTLAPATPRALSQSLRSLATSQLVTRQLVSDYPPTSLYSLTEGGLSLARAA
jgi:DNA-binding HxlR family transcriptional regulator